MKKAPKSSPIGLIIGTGFEQWQWPEPINWQNKTTVYGDPSGMLGSVHVSDKKLLVLPRHGVKPIPPHAVNYRANIQALKASGVKKTLAIHVVGGISDQASKPGTLVIPDQLIDYTWGRKHTYFDHLKDEYQHIDFEHPFSETLRKPLIETAEALNLPLMKTGVYGCTQGPRLETKAEVQRLKRDACDVVGMTLMPEAALAREAGMEYASISLVVNPAAGIGSSPITLDAIKQVLLSGVGDLETLVFKTLLKL